MLKKIFVIIFLASMLQGCTMATAAVNAAGGTVIYDRRPIKMIIKDDDISYAITKKLHVAKDIMQQCHIAVTSYNRVVLIVGQAPTMALKNKVLSIAQTVPGVRRFYNEITIEAPSSSLTRTSDAWITTKVKTRLLATKNLQSGQFKVLTENGTVFLMGKVSRSQAVKAVNVVRHTSGAQKVVKVFEYTRTNQVVKPKMNKGVKAVQPQTDEALYQDANANVGTV